METRQALVDGVRGSLEPLGNGERGQSLAILHLEQPSCGRSQLSKAMMKRLTSIRPFGAHRVFQPGFEQIQHLIGEWPQLPTAGQIDRPVPHSTERPRKDVTCIVEVCAVFQRREHDLLEDVVSGVNIAHNRSGESGHP